MRSISAISTYGIIPLIVVLGSVKATWADEVGKVGVDWLGNDIIIEAVNDPEVEGVTCHMSYFERSVIDRLQKGNWFEDPSNASIECKQTGPIKMGDIDLDRDGEEIFRNSRSLIFKKLIVKRIFDEQNQALIYLAHGRDIQNGSAKNSISVVPLYQPPGKQIVEAN